MRSKTQGYHCEGGPVRQLTANTTRDLRRQLRALGLRLGRWRFLHPAALVIMAEPYAGTDALPGARAEVRNRGGHHVGWAYRHGGRVVLPSRRERELWTRLARRVLEDMPEEDKGALFQPRR